MTYETFLKWIPELVQSELGEGVKVRLHTIHKNNNIRLEALCILEEGCNVAPTIYLQSYYERLQAGVPLKHICSEICREYGASRCGIYMNVQDFCDYEKMKSRVVYKLVNYERNRELLQDVPHRRFLDLAVVYYLLIENQFIGSGTAMIYHHQRQLWQVDEETLYRMASANTERILGHEITPMRQVILSLLQRDMRQQLEGNLRTGACTGSQVDRWAVEILDRMLPQERYDMYVLSNESKYLGAAAALDTGRLRAFADKMGCGLHVIPSSVHEMIVLPETQPLKREDLQRLLREINAEEENVQDFLSDQVYYFDRKKGLCMGKES